MSISVACFDLKIHRLNWLGTGKRLFVVIWSSNQCQIGNDVLLEPKSPFTLNCSRWILEMLIAQLNENFPLICTKRSQKWTNIGLDNSIKIIPSQNDNLLDGKFISYSFSWKFSAKIQHPILSTLNNWASDGDDADDVDDDVDDPTKRRSKLEADGWLRIVR